MLLNDNMSEAQVLTRLRFKILLQDKAKSVAGQGLNSLTWQLVPLGRKLWFKRQEFLKC
jgi:hypothetical protein